MKLKEIYKLQKELMYTDMGGYNGPDGINSPSDVLHRVISSNVKVIVNRRDNLEVYLISHSSSQRFYIVEYIDHETPDGTSYYVSSQLKHGDEILRKMIAATLHPHALISYIHLIDHLDDEITDLLVHLDNSIIRWVSDYSFARASDASEKRFSVSLMAFILKQPERRRLGELLNPDGLDYPLSSPVPIKRPWWKFWG